ncbi:MAG TPA: phosphatase PAP2 family protein [Bacteroidales bacterium]|nr:phosphatase PAP2 family protein [Bacteroidales bacterium]
MKRTTCRNTLMFFMLLVLPENGVFSQNADIRILRALNSPEQLPADNFYKFISDSHSYIIIAGNISLGAAGFIRNDDSTKKKALEMAAASLATLAITQGLKFSINRQRPFVTYPDIMQKTRAGDPSFPSGHTSAAFSFATSISLSYSKWYFVVPSYAWAGTVAYSRMRLGAHYPSDVLAGALIGTGTAWLTHYVSGQLNGKNSGLKSP